MPDALDRSDAIEHELVTRLSGIYSDALKAALRRQHTFLQKVKDVESGKIKPPQYYVDTDQVDKWRKGFLRELMRQQHVVDGIIAELNKAGIKASDLVRKNMAEIWRVNREEIAGMVEKAARKQGVNVSFAQYDKRQLDALMQEEESPFSKIAYRNLGQNPAVRRRLQNELEQATILGESQRDIIGRIRKVTGQSYSQAKRVAQTERTRVQSQARYQTGQEAADMGLRIANQWSTRMIRSREAHVERDGKWAMQGDVFPGSNMKYPGDPAGGAAEVINCFCVLIPHVLRRGENVDGNGNLVTDDSLKSGENATNIASGDNISPESALKGYENDGIIRHETMTVGSADVQSIAKLDLEIYKCVAPDISTDDVVITDKQVQHIFQGHPQKEHAHVMQSLEATIAEPDYILEDSHAEHRIDTAIVMKQFQQENGGYRVILRLATASDPVDQKNSVITAFFISEKKWNKYLRNKTILYKRE